MLLNRIFDNKFINVNASVVGNFFKFKKNFKI